MEALPSPAQRGSGGEKGRTMHRSSRAGRLAALSTVVALALLFTACRSSSGDAGHASETALAPSENAERASSSPMPPKKVTFQAGFKAQANLPFVAVYVARDNGYFAAEGLDVQVVHSSGGDGHLALLAANRIQFSTTTA